MEVYTLFTCDVWKTYDSMRMFFIGTSFKHLYAAIKRMIRQNVAEYKIYDEDETTEEQVSNFMQDMHSARNHDERMLLIRDRLEYAYLAVNNNNSYC